MNDYPLPSAAVAVWFDGNGLSVRIPPAPGADKGHIIHLTDDEYGHKVLSQILRERATNKIHRIGSRGAPTQAQLGDILKQFEATKAIRDNRPKKEPINAISLEDLGLL